MAPRLLGAFNAPTPRMNKLVRTTIGHVGGIVARSMCISICFAFAMLVPASRAAASPDAPQFRLGDAARPFGWSTAVGDVNTDGEPDVAIADHVGHRANEYEYRIELSISGQAPLDVRFQSKHDAVSISLSDVDRDDDLDIVVGVPLSAETVGVWLNDGHGHFTTGDPQRVPVSIQAEQTLETTGSATNFAVFDSSPRRVDDFLPAALRAPPPSARRRLAVSAGHHSPSSSAARRTSPRAPPTASVA